MRRNETPITFAALALGLGVALFLVFFNLCVGILAQLLTGGRVSPGYALLCFMMTAVAGSPIAWLARARWLARPPPPVPKRVRPDPNAALRAQLLKLAQQDPFTLQAALEVTRADTTLCSYVLDDLLEAGLLRAEVSDTGVLYQKPET